MYLLNYHCSLVQQKYPGSLLVLDSHIPLRKAVAGGSEGSRVGKESSYGLVVWPVPLNKLFVDSDRL